MSGYLEADSKLRRFITLIGAAVALLVGIQSAHALPSYARQTGQQCAACHNGFPELTPYGRLFKLNAFTFGGGQSDLPPLAVMVVAGYTNTGAGQNLTGGTGSGAATHYGPNNNFTVPQSASLFYGGRILGDLGLGAFAQVTYNHVSRGFAWDNTDIRWAHSTTLGGETVFGVSLNNNPTVTDLWNSTPAWRYPFVTSGLAPGMQPTATMIEGGFAQRVLGLNAYAFWNRLVYAEIGGYKSLSQGTDVALNGNTSGNVIRGVAPYWRLALQPQWGPHSLEFGTFGMTASLFPGRAYGFGNDHKVDIGIDAQYQYLTDVHSASVQAAWITENQSLTSSFAQGTSANSRDHLRSLNLKTSYYYEQTYGATLSYFRIDGSGDANLYSANRTLSPNTTGWSTEFVYMPFNHGGPDLWPWLNMKIGLQYVWYQKYNGAFSNFDNAGRRASDNNTLFLYDWIAF